MYFTKVALAIYSILGIISVIYNFIRNFIIAEGEERRFLEKCSFLDCLFIVIYDFLLWPLNLIEFINRKSNE